MSRRKKTILLTGFGPFPGVPVNISSVFAEHLAVAARAAFGGADILFAPLPTVWRQAPVQLEQLYFRHNPDIALHFGVSHQAHALTIESRAHNRADRCDALGDGPVLDILTPDGPNETNVTIPTGRLIARLRRQGIPAVLSHDAGNYLCNATLYHSLELMRTLGTEGQCGFVHLPTALPTANRNTGARPVHRQLSFESALNGGLLIVAALLQRPLPAKSRPQSSLITV